MSDLLISLLLSSFLMAILFQCYLTSKQQYLEAENLLAAHFDLQWVSDMIADSVRRAGFTPCLGIDSLQVHDRRTGLRKISGLKLDNQASGFIEVSRMSEYFAPVLNIQSPTQILVANHQAFNEKRSVLIADCTHAEIHQILSSKPLPHASLISLTKPLLFTYDTPAYFGEWLEEKWSIKTNAKGVKALYFKGEQTEELSASIVSLTGSEQMVHGKRLVEIVLGLEKEKTQTIVVAVRG